MSKAKKKRAKLVCPKTFRGKKVRSSKGVCHIVLASGKKKRVKKIHATGSTSRRTTKPRRVYRGHRHALPGHNVDSRGRDSYERQIDAMWDIDPATGSSRINPATGRMYALGGRRSKRRKSRR